MNIDVKKKPVIEEVSELKDIITDVEKSLADNGRVLVRYSGTQNVCRVMVEGPTREETQQAADKIADVVKNVLG